MKRFLNAFCSQTILLAAILLLFSTTDLMGQEHCAMLTHEGNVTMFKGTDAPQQAIDAAADGDIVTLSAGDFDTFTINKSLTIKGNGIDNSVNDSYASDIWLDKDNINVNLEGLTVGSIINNSTGVNLSLNKCKFNCISNNWSYQTANVKAVNSIGGDILIKRAEIINSVVNQCSDYVTALNSIFLNDVPSVAYLTNCIVLNVFNWNKIIADYTVFIHGLDANDGSYTNFNSDMQANSATCKLFAKDTPVFKEGSQWWELIEENATNWLGEDGRQVGIYGGLMPFDPKPSTPRFSLFKVDEKTNADGMLNVEIRLED